MTGAKVIVGLLRRSPDWRHQVLEISDPVPVQGNPVEAFKQCLATIEATIWRYPAQWDKLPVSGKRLHSSESEVSPLAGGWRSDR